MAVISVIVPVYKVEEYLRECIDSILNQTYQDFELILVDDGSPDNCGAICDAYARKDCRVRVIHQKNGGSATARNAGLDIARGEYIAFVDSDDVIAECYLERLVVWAKSHDADIVTCKMKTFEDDLPTYVLSDSHMVTDGREACMRIYEMGGGLWVWPVDKLYHSKLFRTLRFPDGKWHEDQKTTPIAVYHATKVVITQDVLYYYRTRNNSASHQPFSPKKYDDIEAIDYCIAYYKKQGEEELAEKASQMRCILVSKYAITAVQKDAQSKVPKEYRMSEMKAWKNLRKLMSDDEYTYYLAQIHPKWLRPHAYLRKIKHILHIPCN